MGKNVESQVSERVPIWLSNDNMIILQQVRHVPDLKRILVSIGKLAEDGYQKTLHDSTWVISQGNLKIDSGNKYNNLYSMMAIHPEGALNVA